MLLEAMASGMAVITITETCGMQDVVDTDTGAIEEAVLRLAASPGLRSSLGQAAQKMMARYTWERSTIKFDKLLRHVVALEGKPPG